ncbi:MAG: type II toxin-antitoxin system Phd/YefM family antitoxin [Patescibacteria group bacterium]
MYTVSITDLRQNASNILDQVVSTKEPAYIIQNSEVKAVVLDIQDYNFFQEALEDLTDGLDSQEAVKQGPSVSIDDYIATRWGEKKHAGSSGFTSPKRPRQATR